MRKASVFGGLLCGLLGLVGAVACGGSEKDDGGSGDASLDFGDDSTGGNMSGGGDDDTNPSSCESPTGQYDCVGLAYEGESVPLAIYVMFDLSCSMSCDLDHSGCCRDNDPGPRSDWRIEPVREALRSFLRDPLSAGISVGLGFFGDHPLSQSGSPEVCSVDAHADPSVEIAPLPGSADALIAELDAGEPQGGTPTHLAIEGACAHVDAWKGSNPAYKVVNLLVTDGIPQAACDASIQRATAAAADCYASGDGYQTYVLGVAANNNNSLDQLNEIAERGGTEQAYITNTADVSGSVLEALNSIRSDAAIPCTLRIPEPPADETVNPDRVNLGICDAEEEVVETPRVQSQDGCGDEPGWYYDDNSSPSVIELCDVTCDTVSAPGASLFLGMDCNIQLEPPDAT